MERAVQDCIAGSDVAAQMQRGRGTTCAHWQQSCSDVATPLPPTCTQVLLAAAAHADVEVAQAACCLPPRAPGTPAFAAELLGALLVHADRSVRVGAPQCCCDGGCIGWLKTHLSSSHHHAPPACT